MRSTALGILANGGIISGREGRDADGSGRVVISFETRALRDACREVATATALYGEPASAALRRVIADLRAADTMFDVRSLFELPSGASAEFSTQLGSSHRLVVRCSEKKPPLVPSGEVDWDAVDRIRVLSVLPNDQ